MNRAPDWVKSQLPSKGFGNRLPHQLELLDFRIDMSNGSRRGPFQQTLDSALHQSHRFCNVLNVAALRSKRMGPLNILAEGHSEKVASEEEIQVVKKNGVEADG